MQLPLNPVSSALGAGQSCRWLPLMPMCLSILHLQVLKVRGSPALSWQQFKKKNLLIYFCLCWVFIVASAFSSCGEQELLFSCHVQTSHFGGFSCCEASLGPEGFSGCPSQALEHRLDSCGAGAQLFCSMWGLPESGIELVSPALAGIFFTNEPPGKAPLQQLLIPPVILAPTHNDLLISPCPYTQ